MRARRSGQIERRRFLAGGLGALTALSPPVARSQQSPILKPAVNLRCEYLVDPMGIDVVEPRLFWEVQDDRRGVRQTAYRIVIASSLDLLRRDQGDLWDSGRVESDETVHVTYKGKPLESRARCYWKVRSWLAATDDHSRVAGTPWSQPAAWSMGLLDPSDWQATWIADPAPMPPASPPHRGYRSQGSATPDAEKWIVIELKAPARFEAVRLIGAQTSVHGFLFPLRFRLEVSDDPNFAEPRTVADRTSADVANPGEQPFVCRFTPVSARYVRLVATRLRPDGQGGYGIALAEIEVLNQGKNLARGAKVSALDSIETPEWSTSKLVDGDIAGHAAGRVQSLTPPLIRKEFALAAEVRRATLYATALGLYEIHLNGRRVGDHILAPEWTDYAKCVNYQTYDVTGLVRRGENAMGVLLGDGWYAGRIAHVPFRFLYGRKAHFKAQLEVEFTDGRKVSVTTDRTWRSTTSGPIRSSGIFEGESYDARCEIAGWDKPGFNDSAWPAVEADNQLQVPLIGQLSEPIRVSQKLPAKLITEPEPGVYIFDLGQNMVGWVNFKLRAAAGNTIQLRHSEVLAPDGTLYVAYLRTAFQDDVYIARGDPAGETFEPHFTFHGFRYVEVTGLRYKPAPADLTGIVFHSAAPQTGFLDTSSTLINRIWQNTLWSQRGNLQGVMIDCPQRDERLPWICGDYHSFDESAIFNMDMAATFTRRARDVRQAQYADGRYPNMAPNVFQWGTNPGWGDEGALLPWVAYLHYGDQRIVGEHFESARRWVEWVLSQTKNYIWDADGPKDWLNADSLDVENIPPSGAAVGKDVFATVFFACSTRLVAKMANALGRVEDARHYEELFQSIRQAFNRDFVDGEGRIKGDTQAGYALALHFDLLPETLRESAVSRMVKGIRQYRGHVSTGFMATHRMLLQLSQMGHNDISYDLIHQRTCPSWGFMIDQGATTMWERWDAFVPGRELSALRDAARIELPLVTGFQTTHMTSFNHCALGSVVEWMYRVILGIEPDEQHAGYKHFSIRPLPGKELTFAQGTFHSIRGPIGVRWRKERGVFTLAVEIPPNTSATVYVPANRPADITESGKPPASAAGVEFLSATSGTVVYRIGSGHYRFESAL